MAVWAIDSSTLQGDIVSSIIHGMASPDRDYYEVLGVPHDADDKTIKAAYHKLAMQWHPDRNDSPEAEARFKEIAKAYAILKDPKKRARYDSMGMEGVAHFTTEDLFGDLDLGNLFGDMGFGFGGGNIFDRLFGGSRRASRSGSGQDLRISVELSLETIHNGGQQDIRVSHPVGCPHCHGYGTADGNPPPLCPACNGSGRKVVGHQEQRNNQTVQFQQIHVCPVCHGKGTQIDAPCPDCGGYGKVEKEETLKITIPPGIEEGTVLRVAGHGLPADDPKLPPGDLHVTVYARPDPRFSRRGPDLWHPVSIDDVDAVLGAEIEVPSIDGHVKVKIPPGTQPDEILRLKGKGLNRFQTGGRGDLNLRITVRIPKEPDEETRKLYEQIRQQNT